MSSLSRLEFHQETQILWDDLLTGSAMGTPFLTPQWQKVWWDQFGEGAEMLLLGFQGENSIEAIAPLARRNGTISFIGGQDLCDYNDFLVSPGSESRFFPSLLECLDSVEWETLEFTSLHEDSPTLAYLPALAKERGYRVEVGEEDVAPGLNLPESWDNYLQGLSQKDRHELRRKFRRLDSLGDGYRYYKFSEPLQVDENLGDFFSLMRDSREVKHRFLTGPREQFFRNIAREMAAMGVFKLFFLELEGKRVAATMCFDYGDARLLYNSGFNRDYSYYSVGLILKALCVKDAIEEGKAYFDFLRGPEPYKYDLGGANKTLYQMVVRRS